MGIIAGIIIALCAKIFLTVDNSFIGALLFSMGLCVIVANDYKLYTGKIGYITKENWKDMLVILRDNFVGVGGICLILCLSPSTEQNILFVNTKLNINPLIFFVNSIFCGCLMYFAVSSYKKTKNFIPVILCIMGFILGKFEHCIADLAYFIITKTINLQALGYFLIAVIGNTIGSKVINILEKYEVNNK